MMKVVATVLSLTLACAACASSNTSGGRRDTDPTYTVHKNDGTSVTVTTGAEIGQTSQALVTNADPATAPGHGQEDSQLSSTVRSELRADRALRTVPMEKVRITVVESTAYLNGSVPTVADSVAVEQRVREVKGVKSVRNELEVLH